jgi:hypothetical protein
MSTHTSVVAHTSAHTSLGAHTTEQTSPSLITDPLLTSNNTLSKKKKIIIKHYLQIPTFAIFEKVEIA